MNVNSQIIIKKIAEQQNPKKAEWLENYVKHDIKSLGVGIPEIRKIVKNVNAELNLTKLPEKEQIDFLNELMQNQFTENKLAAILYLQLFWQHTETKTILNLISGWFDKRWISDWNVCDWLCVRIISPQIDKSPENTIRELAKWNKDDYLWKARASLVPFAQCKSIKKHIETINEFFETLIKRNERFCKTSVGWVLREYSKLNTIFVINFLEKHKLFTTKEVVRNATKYF